MFISRLVVWFVLFCVGFVGPRYGPWVVNLLLRRAAKNPASLRLVGTMRPRMETVHTTLGSVTPTAHCFQATGSCQPAAFISPVLAEVVSSNLQFSGKHNDKRKSDAFSVPD